MSKRISRRHVLQGVGACMSLPFLDAMVPAGRAAEKAVTSPKRFAAITQSLGCIHDTWFPTEAGAGYTMPRVLKALESERKDLTVFSNIDHGVKGGHHAANAVLNGIRTNSVAIPNFGAQSIDQQIVETVAGECRYDFLGLWGGNQSLTSSCTRSGSFLPPSATVPSAMYKLLFVNGRPDEVATAEHNLKAGGSILDVVRDQARSLSKDLGKQDREKLDEYFTAVRATERKLGSRKAWLRKPKPSEPRGKQWSRIASGATDDLGIKSSLATWIDLTHLALSTDSTRVVNLSLPIQAVWDLPGISKGTHYYSHHGKEESKKEAFRTIEGYIIGQYGRLITKLREDVQPDGSTLLDATALLYASGLSNGSTHSNTNLPVILAGGGFKHGGHFDNPQGKLLNSLYLSLLQRHDPAADFFNGVKKTMSELA